MKFAENNRISHRQLYRQIVLAFFAPLLLCLFREGNQLGMNGLAGTVAAVALLLFYVIWLIRLAPYYGDLKKSAGSFWGPVLGIFFLVYTIFTGAYLLSVLEEIVPVSLVKGISGKFLSAAAAAVCALGTHKGMQRRGRGAEVSGGILLAAVFLMLLLCAGQGHVSWLAEMRKESPVTADGFWKSTYGCLCAFSGTGLMPFVLGNVEKQGSSGKAAALGILTLGGILTGMELVLPAVLGWNRLNKEVYPVLPLLAGADLPGNVLARFDVLWMGFVIYSLLFALGSLFHYGHQIIRNSRLGTGRIWMAVLTWLLSVGKPFGYGIGDYYGVFLGYIFVPGLLLAQFFLIFRGKQKRKKRLAGSAVSLFLLCILLAGCSGMEPEKRSYPLALGVEQQADGFTVYYGMADMPEATGQEKPSDEGPQLLSITGKSFEEIDEKWLKSQEKYLDLGHLQILILGDGLAAGEGWKVLLDYLKQEPQVGENIYVFRTANPEEVLKWTGSQGSTSGKYIQGILENRPAGEQISGTTLRRLYYEKEKSGTLPQLLRIHVSDKALTLSY